MTKIHDRPVTIAEFDVTGEDAALLQLVALASGKTPDEWVREVISQSISALPGYIRDQDELLLGDEWYQRECVGRPAIEIPVGYLKAKDAEEFDDPEDEGYDDDIDEIVCLEDGDFIYRCKESASA